MISCASERNSCSALSLGPSIVTGVLLGTASSEQFGSLRSPLRSFDYEAPHHREELLGGERLDDIGIGAELHAAVAVDGPAVGGDEDQRSLPVAVALAHEAHQLEAVDVGHVD